MFKIGDFSKLSQVSVRALRLYDQMGLLKPACVDQFTGYRYYSTDQLSQLNRIVAFKDLGFSLEQIAGLLDEQIPASQIRGMLRLKQAELQQLVEAEQARLARVEARLKQIEQEDTVSTYDVVLKKVESQMVAAIRDVIPVCGDMEQLHYELETYLGKHGARMAGFPLTIWYDTDYRLHDVDAEAIVPIDKSLSGNERVRIRLLPGVELMACVIHHGSYNTTDQTYNALLRWIEANRYHIVGPNREIYLRLGVTGADIEYPANYLANNVSEYVTEIQFPVKKA